MDASQQESADVVAEVELKSVVQVDRGCMLCSDKSEATVVVGDICTGYAL